MVFDIITLICGMFSLRDVVTDIPLMSFKNFVPISNEKKSLIERDSIDLQDESSSKRSIDFVWLDLDGIW